MIGRVVDGHRIEAVLGEGGMAVVYRARSLSTGAYVAIKVLAGIEDRDAMQRFSREGALMSALVHPHLVALHEMGEIDGQPYLVTEYMEGGTLRQRLRGAALPVADAVAMGRALLSALGACHARGVVHRDVKPENLLFDGSGTIKLADLGLALDLQELRRLTQTGSILGTPRYLSPEQATATEVTSSSDLYAAAIVIYEMLAGRPPFVDSDLFALIK